MPKISLSPFLKAAPAYCLFALAGCSSVSQIDAPALSKAVEEKISNKPAQLPVIYLRAGDSLLATLRSLSLIDGKTYIIEGDGTKPLPGASSAIGSQADLVRYFEAYGLTAQVTPVEGTNYVRIRVNQSSPQGKVKANDSNCYVTLAGSVPFGQAVSEISKKAKIDAVFADGGSAAHSAVLYPVSYQGRCAGALEYLAKKAELSVVFDDALVEFRMMDSANIDLGIPLRDRKIVMDILADGAASSGASGATSSSASTAGASSGGTQTGGNKGLVSSYLTNYTASIKAILDSTKTPFGSWHYVPETGQVFIRDKAEAVAAAKASLNKMAQAFQGRYEVTLTLYRMTVTKDRKINGSLVKSLNESLALNFGFPALTKSAVSATYTDGTSKNAIQLLSEWGTVETMDSFSLTLQSGIPQTLKVANNTEYVRNVSTTTSSTGGVTSSAEQANATDGYFVTMQARQTEAGKIAVDYGAFVNRLDGFDVTQTTSSTVKSQKGFERTFDAMAVVDDGIPYIASIVSQKSRNDAIATLPGLESQSGAPAAIIPLVAGSRSDASSQTYIVVMVEARRQ